MRQNNRLARRPPRIWRGRPAHTLTCPQRKRAQGAIHIQPQRLQRQFGSLDPRIPVQQVLFPIHSNMSSTNQSEDRIQTRSSTSRPSTRPSSRISRPASRTTSVTTSRPSSRPASRTPPTSPHPQGIDNPANLTSDEINDIQQADTQPFNSDSDDDYLEISRQMDENEVNIKSDELHSFIGADVSITLHGDERDKPSIQGKVVLVQDGAMSLSPAIIDGREFVHNTVVEILHIEKCTTIPERWDQPEQGPSIYMADKPAQRQEAEEPLALDKRVGSHKRQPSQGHINVVDLQGPTTSSEEQQPRSRPTTPGKRHRIQLIQAPETPAKLVRTDSIYPLLHFPTSFSDKVKQGLPTQEQHARDNPQDFTTVDEHVRDAEEQDQQRIDTRHNMWLTNYPYEHDKEEIEARAEERLPNYYKAVERACHTCMITIERTVLYQFTFHPELQTPPKVIAAQIWNHLADIGIQYEPSRAVVTCKGPPRPFLHPETKQYIGYWPKIKPAYKIKPLFTFSGELDAFALRRKYELSHTKLTYTAWLRSAKITDIMKLNKINIALPSTFSLITTEQMKTYFIQKWESTFDQIAITFDEWFNDYGYREKLHKMTNVTSKNELTRYKIPTWPESTTQEIYSDNAPKQQDIAKYVTPRLTRDLNRSTSPSRMEKALTYLRINEHNHKGLTTMFHKWTADAKDLEFEEFVKTNTLPRQLPTSNPTWNRYRSHSFSSSQEDSLLKHMAQINLSSSTPTEKKNFRSFHSDHPETYEKCFGTAAILQPASSFDFLTTAMHVQANYKLTPTTWPTLMAINPNDFRPQGRFAHIYIPKYVYVPREIFTYMGLPIAKHTPLYHLTWQFCYAARREADKWITEQDIGDSVSHWNDILINAHGLNNMNLSLIDVVQVQAAHKWKNTMISQETDPFVWYDLFIRPTEPLFANKAQMNEQLTLAFKCQQHTMDFFNLVCNLVNIPQHVPLTAIECVEEMSKIRHLPAKNLIQIAENDTPLCLTNKVRLESNTKLRIWDSICEADKSIHSDSSGRGSMVPLQNHRLTEVQQSYLDTRIEDCQYELQQIRELRRKTTDFLDRAERTTSPIFGQQPTPQKEMERKYYHSRLQFLNMRMQTLQEETDLLHAQRDHMVKENKALHQMSAQEIDDLVDELQHELYKLQTATKVINNLLCDTPDTDEEAPKRAEYTQRLRLTQVRESKLTDYIEKAQSMKAFKRMDAEVVKPKVRPAPREERRPNDQQPEPEQPRYSTRPIKTTEERTKAPPALPTYGYVARQQDRAGRPTGTTKKPTRTYTADQPKSKPDVQAPDWMNLPMSANEYVHNRHPMPQSDDPTVIKQPLYRKFNADGINDYCQIIMETGYDKQQEVIVINELIGHADGWDTTHTPLLIPLSAAHDILDKIKQAGGTRLRAFNKDNASPHTFLWQSMLERGRTCFELSVAQEEGPRGKERMLTLSRLYINPHKYRTSIKIPWIMIPRMAEQMESLIDELECAPIDSSYS